MPGLVTRAGLERLSSDPEVARIDIDRGGHATDAESLPLIGGDVAHSEGLTGKGVTVAVLDSGIDETHPDLAVPSSPNIASSYPTAARAERRSRTGPEVRATTTGTERTSPESSPRMERSRPSESR